MERCCTPWPRPPPTCCSAAGASAATAPAGAVRDCAATLRRRRRVVGSTPPGLLCPSPPGVRRPGPRDRLGHKERGVVALAPPLGGCSQSVAGVSATLRPGRGPGPGAVAAGERPLPRLRADPAITEQRRGRGANRLPATVAPLLRSRPGVRDQAGLDAAARRVTSPARWRPSGPAPRGRAGAPVHVVVCDDVVTTGSTAREAHARWRPAGVGVAGVASWRRPPTSQIHGDSGVTPIDTTRPGLTSLHGVRPGPWLRRVSALADPVIAPRRLADASRRRNGPRNALPRRGGITVRLRGKSCLARITRCGRRREKASSGARDGR